VFPANPEPIDKEALTAEFAAFAEARSQLAVERQEGERSWTAEGLVVTLQAGRLTVYDSEGVLLWQTPETWWVEDVSLADVDADGRLDVLFSLWKSWSFAGEPPLYAEDSPVVLSHLFLYTFFEGKPKAVWCSSALPRPLLAIELSLDGEQTPVRSGALLHTREGEYAEDAATTLSSAGETKEYAWEKWGFVPLD
jgi:hypothetical protein